MNRPTATEMADFYDGCAKDASTENRRAYLDVAWQCRIEALQEIYEQSLQPQAPQSPSCLRGVAVRRLLGESTRRFLSVAGSRRTLIAIMVIGICLLPHSTHGLIHLGNVLSDLNEIFELAFLVFIFIAVGFTNSRRTGFLFILIVTAFVIFIKIGISR
jgi:hypothetical protein